ncbi:MAG: DUF805 domain-containing protein [Flavobacteriaceae bacterium]
MKTTKSEREYNMLDWWKKVAFENYANFEGRARRSEYWYFTLTNILITLGIYIIFAAIAIPNIESDDPPPLLLIPLILLLLFSLGIMIPSLAVAVRRLHDTGKSGWFLLFNLIPFGGIVLLVFYIQDGDLGENRYGPNPKEKLLSEE